MRLEVGFGGGEHLASDALAHPERGFLGCEPFVNGVAKLMARIEASGLRNIRVHPGDAGDLIDALPAASLSGVCILYPDPWPKRRHKERRFISDRMLGRIARVMRPGAELRFASDIDDYVSLDARAHPALPGFPLAGADRGGMVDALAQLERHALRGQGDARGPAPRLPHVSPALTPPPLRP